MPANWQTGYGAGGAADALRQILTDRLTAEKVAEENRRTKVAEEADAARMAQQADQFRQMQAARQGEFVSGRDERYQEALRDVRRQDLMTQERATERDINRKTKLDEQAEAAAERKLAREERVLDREDQQAFQAAQGAANRALSRDMGSESRALANEMKQLQIDAAREKMEAGQAAKAKAASEAQASTATALESVRRLRSPKMAEGLEYATGAYEQRGFTQPAQDFAAERDRLVAMLALPNLGALKGPMSDKDILFIKQISSKLQNPKISAKAARQALQDAEEFLLRAQGAAPPPGGLAEPRMGRTGAPGAAAAPMEFDYVNGQFVPRGGG